MPEREDNPEHLDYLRVHNGLLRRIITGIDHALRRSDHRALLYRPGDALAFYKVEGDADLPLVDTAGLPPLDAMLGDLLVDQAEMAMNEAVYTLQRELPQCAHNVTFDHAVCRLINAEGAYARVELSVLELFNVAGVGDVICTSYYASEHGVQVILQILGVNERIESVESYIGTGDQLFYYACQDVFGPHSKINRLLRGEFADETELDAALADIQATWPDGADEELGDRNTFMYEVRLEALTQKQSRDMRRATGLDQLSQDRLKAIADFVEAIQL